MRQRTKPPMGLMASVACNVAAGAALALGVLVYLALVAEPETAALIDGGPAPLITLLIVALSLVLYLGFGVALTGFLFVITSDE
jgi:hypothetical protein